MSKNIGLSKSDAEHLASMLTNEWDHIEAYAQKEEHFQQHSDPAKMATYQWIVVLQKRRMKK